MEMVSERKKADTSKNQPEQGKKHQKVKRRDVKLKEKQDLQHKLLLILKTLNLRNPP